MKEIFVNLKRFDVPRELGGLCHFANPQEWIESVIEETIKYGLGKVNDLHLTYFLPEALILNAINVLKKYPEKETFGIDIGCQGVFREDIKKGGNFGAFTSNLPATAAKNLGCTWAMIGHSEERADKMGLLEEFEKDITENITLRTRAREVVDITINKEVLCALRAGLNILVCVGESTKERGAGEFIEQKPRIKSVLQGQLIRSLRGNKKDMTKRLIIGYEPIWAIGPGKTPPGKEYISFVSSFIKKTVKKEFDFEPAVVYGGGLKVENAGILAKIDTINGGLIALTQFKGEIGFSVKGLNEIILKYLENNITF
jgi:triosephosphate isomerase (TIM)